jgi:hypothetical protein
MSKRANAASKATTNYPNRQLGLYSLAAVAAGVSILALAPPAEAEVVVTQKTIPIPIENVGHGGGVAISFQNDGANDLRLILSSFSVFGAIGNSLKAVNASYGQGVVGRTSFTEEELKNAFPLAKGAQIGAGRYFVSGAGKGTYFSYRKSAVRLAATARSTFGPGNAFGPWAGNDRTAYLGVRFLIDGETHYGWVRLTVNITGRSRSAATITSYAYETESGKPIFAGLTEAPTAEVQAPENMRKQVGPSLGMLAVGAEGFPLWRREATLTPK